MTGESRRAAILIALTTAAVALPAAAWWFSGLSDVSARAARYEGEIRRESEREARLVASRVADSLERVSELETRRPWRHYRSGDAMRIAPWRSDPLVLAHFEIGPRGAVRLTEISEDPTLPSPPLLCTLRDEVGALAPELWRAVRPECMEGPLPDPGDAGEPGVVCVGPLTWTTATLAGTPSLLALRHVETDAGGLTQGLVIDGAALRNLEPGAALRPGRAPGDSAAPVRLLGTEWHVAVDDAPLAELASDRARELRAGFVSAYALGLVLAGLAGIAAIVLAWQALYLARRRAELTAIAAHELRTPLAGIRLHAGMLAAGLGDPSRAKEQARRVSDEAWRLSRVVHNLLDSAARDGSGVHPRAGDLAAALGSAIATVAPAIEASGASIALEVPHDLPAAQFDEEATIRILHDLLDNAEKHARGHADRSIRVSARAMPSQSRVEVAVDDAGPGIPKRERRRAFRPFARGLRHDGPSGLGLGLALARRRARAMHGDLTCVESDRGGARLLLTLPMAPN